MRVAQTGDRVRVHFTGKLRDGTVVESSRSSEPLEFTLGEREVMKGLEDLVEGMKSGETRHGLIPPENAHGPHRNDLLLAVERERFPRHIDPYTGLELRMKRNDLAAELVKVVATTADMVLLDRNHPLAGKSLTVEVELLDIMERYSGVPG